MVTSFGPACSETVTASQNAREHDKQGVDARCILLEISGPTQSTVSLSGVENEYFGIV